MIQLNYLALFFLWPSVLLAEQVKTPLPDPLTLEAALSLASDMSHADIIQADSLIEMAESDLRRAESGYALEADISLQARWSDPSSLPGEQSNDDHRAILSFRKPLYDFGQTEKNVAAAEIEKAALTDSMSYWLQKRKIDIARAFFDVILADYKERWDNETVVISYVHHDAAKDRHALGEISDLDLLKSKNELEFLQSQRSISRTQQLVARSQLAEVINRPGDLSSNLKLPELNYYQRKLPEYDKLSQQLMGFNQSLRLLAARVDAAEKKLAATQAQDNPRLTAEVRFSEYERTLASNNDWLAELKLTVPLLAHDGMKADISKARSHWLNQRAMLLKAQTDARQKLLQLWQKISYLNVQRSQMLTAMEYRELDLDRNRVLYEMEAATDFGDALVAISETRYKQLQIDFELALAWMNLELMFDGQINFDGSGNE